MIKFVFRWAFRLVVLALVLAIGFLLLKDRIARNLAEEHLRQETGFDVRIGKLEFSLFSPRLFVENVVVYNPAEFGGSLFLDVPHLHAEYDRKQLAIGKLRLKLLRLNVRELHIVENQNGRTNLIDVLHRTIPEMLGDKSAGGPGYSFAGIETLNLSLGTVRYSNLRLPKRNQVLTLNLANDLTKNIRTEQDFAGVFLKVLLRAGITIYHEPSVALPKRKPAVLSNAQK